MRLCWWRSTTEWDGDELVTRDYIVDWREMCDSRAEERARLDRRQQLRVGKAPTYGLEQVAPGIQMVATPAVCTPVGGLAGVTLEVLLAECRLALAGWLEAEWLRPHGFVNLRQREWSSLTSWYRLALDHGCSAPPQPVEVFEWYLVSQNCVELLLGSGGAVCELPGMQAALFGRTEFGQPLADDRLMGSAMVRSGYLKDAPPLGLLVDDPAGVTVLGGRAGPRLVWHGAGDPVAILRPEAVAAGWTVRLEELEELGDRIRLLFLCRPGAGKNG